MISTAGERFHRACARLTGNCALFIARRHHLCRRSLGMGDGPILTDPRGADGGEHPPPRAPTPMPEVLLNRVAPRSLHP